MRIAELVKSVRLLLRRAYIAVAKWSAYFHLPVYPVASIFRELYDLWTSSIVIFENDITIGSTPDGSYACSYIDVERLVEITSAHWFLFPRTTQAVLTSVCLADCGIGLDA